MPTDTKLEKLIINKLTLEQYQSIENPSDSELYFVDNEADGFPAQPSGSKGMALLAGGDGTTYWGAFPSLDAEHEWTAKQTYTADVDIASTGHLNVDVINSKATGNSLLRMYYDADSAYKCLVGSVYRTTTLLGSADRPYYAKEGEDFQANPIALLSDVKRYIHTIIISYVSSGQTLYGCFTAYSNVATACTSYDLLHSLFNGKTFAISGFNMSGTTTFYLLNVDFTGGTNLTDGIYFANADNQPAKIVFANMAGASITDTVTE